MRKARFSILTLVLRTQCSRLTDAILAMILLFIAQAAFSAGYYHVDGLGMSFSGTKNTTCAANTYVVSDISLTITSRTSASLNFICSTDANFPSVKYSKEVNFAPDSPTINFPRAWGALPDGSVIVCSDNSGKVVEFEAIFTITSSYYESALTGDLQIYSTDFNPGQGTISNINLPFYIDSTPYLYLSGVSNDIVCNTDKIIIVPFGDGYSDGILKANGLTIATFTSDNNFSYSSNTPIEYEIPDLDGEIILIELETPVGIYEISIRVAAPLSEDLVLSVDKSLPLCNAEPITLSINSPPDTKLTWPDGGPTINNPTNTDYSVIVQKEIDGAAVCPSVTKSIKIVIFDFIPTINEVGPIVRCEGDPVTLSAGPSGDFAYTWSRGTGAAGTGSTIEVEASGNYTVSITPISVACPPKTSSVISVTFDAQIPDIPITSSDTNNIICGTANATSIKLTANPAGVSYSWVREDGGAAGNGREITITQSGNYTVNMSRGACTRSQSIDIIDNNYDPKIIQPPAAYCSDAPIILTAAEATADRFDYIWKRDGTVVGENAPTLALGSDPGNYIYVLEISAKGNSCGPKTSQEVPIRVDRAITGGEIVLPGSKTKAIICGAPQETSITLKAVADAPLDGIVYGWTGPESSSRDSLRASRAGEYQVTLTRGSCSNELSVDVGSGAFTPSIAVSAATIITSPNEARICQGEGAGIKSAVTGTTFANTEDNFTYEWFGGEDAMTPLTNQTGPNLPVAGSGNYSLKMTLTGSGCAAKNATPQAIRVTADPAIANPVITPNPAIICNKEDGLTLSAHADSSAGIRYAWTGNGTLGADSSEFVVNNAGTYTVTFERGACKETMSVSPREQALAVNVMETGSSSPILLCSGENNVPVELKAESNLSTATIKWFRQNGSPAPGIDSGSVYIPTETGTYYAVAQFNSCTAKSAQTVSTELLSSFTATIGPEDIAAFCEDKSVKLDAQASPANQASKLEYIWSQDGNVVKTASGSQGSSLTTGKNVNYNGNTLTNQVEADFTVTVSIDGCKATSPAKKITIKPSRTGIIVIDRNTLEATESIDNAYQWYYKESVTTSPEDTVRDYLPEPGQTSRILMGAKKGSYFVRANRNGCGVKNSLAYAIDIVTAVNPAEEMEWKVYPNPAIKSINLEQVRQNSMPANVILRNVEGKLLRQNRQVKAIENYPLDNLASGVYFLEINQGDKIINKKFVKQ